MPPFFVSLALGAAILFAGSELLLRATASLTRKFGVGNAAISLSIAAIAFASPAIFTVLQAAASGSPELAGATITGNVLWSTLGIVGLCAYVTPLATNLPRIKTDAVMLVLAAAFFLFAAHDGEIVPWEALLMLAGLTYYMLHVYQLAETRPPLITLTKPTDCTFCAAAYFCVGTGLVITGSDIVIDGSAWLAKYFHLSETLAGNFVTGFVVCLPLLISALTLLHKKQASLVLPLTLYTALFALLGATGIAAAFSPLPIMVIALQPAMTTMLIGCLLLALLLHLRPQFGAKEGLSLIALFMAYGVYSFGF